MFKEMLGGIGRTAGSFVAGVLLAKGILSPDDADKVGTGVELVVTGAVGGLITAGLSVLSKIKIKKKIDELKDQIQELKIGT